MELKLIMEDSDNNYYKKINHAIKLLQSIPQDSEIELCYSGGKDSDVILELAKMSGIPFKAIYKNTTIDPPGTIKHCKDKGVEIVQPRITFLNLVKKKGIPTRRRRFCCEVLKEYKILDRSIQGIRRCESNMRAKRYKEPEFCRTYNKKEKVRVYLPILEWTNKDVERFINEHKIECHPLYYDDKGKFRVERRLGCIGCPMKSDNGVREFLKYPKLLKQIIKSADEFLTTHPQCASAHRFKNAYELVYYNLFCLNIDKYNTLMADNHLFNERFDCEKVIKSFFKLE